MAYKYQLGIDDDCTYNNAAYSNIINLENAPSFLSGNLVYPWVYNVNDRMWHFIDLSSVTTSSMQVSPLIVSESASLVINYNGPSNLSSSVTSSAGFVIYGSGSDGFPHAVGVTQNSDGSWSLQTDTELILSGDIVVSNVMVYSKDGTSSSLGYGRISEHDSVFVTSSYDYPVNVKDSYVSGAIVNFASETFNENRINILYSMFPYQLGVDEGTYTNNASSTTVNIYGTSAITGSTICPWVYNTTDLTWHYVNLTSVTTSSFTVSPAITSASSSLVVRFNRAKKAYSSAADAYQVYSTIGDPPRINGPCTLFSGSGNNSTFPNGTTILGGGPIPCAMYGRIGIQIVWSTTAGTRTFQFRCYGKIDSDAWPSAGLIPAAYQIESATDWHYTISSTTFGAAASANGTIIAWFDDPKPFDSIAIEMIVAGTDANNSSVVATYILYGGTK